LNSNTKQGIRLGLIDKFEKGLERKVTGLFSKAFKSSLEPVEIASAIRHEMDARASILGPQRILVPNRYLVKLSPQDHERLGTLGEPLIDELIELATQHSKKQGFQFGELLAIELTPDSSLVLGQIEVQADSKKYEVSWVPVLLAGSARHEITKPRTTVGRDSSADIQIGDNGLSRKHFEILWDGTKAAVRDLGSTNGTKVGGKKIDQVALSNGTALVAGRTEFMFNLIARFK
jgi:hypothetical protein